MKHRSSDITRTIHNAALALMTIAALSGCAAISNPDGGAYDETPPVITGSTPKNGATNVRNKKITIEFDEFIKLENASEKVVFSPPQIEQPEIKVVGKKIQVELFDSLRENTTYSIDFADGIVDNNEGNPDQTVREGITYRRQRSLYGKRHSSRKIQDLCRDGYGPDFQLLSA